jgi:hypothetical protein
MFFTIFSTCSIEVDNFFSTGSAIDGSVGFVGGFIELSAGEENTLRSSSAKIIVGLETFSILAEPELEASAKEASRGMSCSVCAGVVRFTDCGDCSDLRLCS